MVENAGVGSVLLRYWYRDGTPQAAFPMRVVSDDGERVVAWLAPGTEIMYWALPGGADPRSLPLEKRFTAHLTSAPRRWQGGGVLRVIPINLPYPPPRQLAASDRRLAFVPPAGALGTHAAATGLGNVAPAVSLTGGHRNDVTQLLPLIDAIPSLRCSTPGDRAPRRRPRLRPRRGAFRSTACSLIGLDKTHPDLIFIVYLRQDATVATLSVHL